MKSRSRTAAVLAALAGLLIACGSDGSDAQLRVVATTAIAADITKRLAGDRADVQQLIPSSVSPHDFEASARDRQRVADADLVVEFGNGLEAALPTAGAASVFTITDHSGKLRHGEHEHEDGEGGAGGAEELGDAHVWMDPTRIARAVPALGDALEAAAPGGRFANRAREYARRLRELDDEIHAITAAIPVRRRKLVTSHEALGYFAQRYGFEVVATPFGLSPDAEASAQDLSRVVDAIEREDVEAVFVAQGDDPQLLERVADSTGVAVVDDLLIESFGPSASSYEQMVRFTARRIVGALGG